MKSSAAKKSEELSSNNFPVVGIGASAGGLEAFKKFIKAIPKNSGVAYILVQHLHPGHESALPDILQRVTQVPVVEISDNVVVEPDHIYVIPSNKILTATDGVLKLDSRPHEHSLNTPVDTFFSSLAEVHQAQSIGIILSGTGSDGTEGLKDIKDHGGFTLVQSPGSAAYNGMPKHAIDSGIIDFILPPEKMPEKLMEIKQFFNKGISGGETEQNDKLAEDGLRHIFTLLRKNMGADFSFYKQTTIRRRIIRRMLILKFETIEQYVKYFSHNADEQSTLFNELLIPVTSFFRDKPLFDSMAATVIPEIIKNKTAFNPLRVWVAGCSTGQEAYSIAIMILEYLSKHNINIKVQIFASDISEKSIEKARAGIYSSKETENISEERLNNFFSKKDGTYQVKKMVRDICIFAAHNCLKDPPFAKVDMISCRNVFIYFEPLLQKKMFGIFHYALNEKGILWLGRSESAGSASDLFIPFSKKDNLYNKKFVARRLTPFTGDHNEKSLNDKNYFQSNNENKTDDYQKNVDEILLARYMPAGVVVNEQHDIIQFRGSTGEFLEPPPGKATLNVIKMAKEGLGFEIRNALHKSKLSREPFIKKDIPFDKNKKLITLEIVPLLNLVDPHFLILFRQSGTGDNYLRSDKGENNSGTTPALKRKKNASELHIIQLEKELAELRENMRTITEDQEAANEELQSANEELHSGTEELQSLNEELETSKEELQSTNEELVIVNQELTDRNGQLIESRQFADATISSLHEPLLALDRNYRIKSANKAFYKTFDITEDKTLGKILFELNDSEWDDSGLRKELANILKETKDSIETEINLQFLKLGARTLHFNIQTIKRLNGEQLILLALEDITLKREAEKLRIKKQSEENLKITLESIPQIIVTLSSDNKATFFNKYFLNYTGLTLKKAIAGEWKKAIHQDDRNLFIKKGKHSLTTGENFYMEIRFWQHEHKTYCWHLARGIPVKDRENKIISWLGTGVDINEQKTKEEKKDEFISIASHEMKTPLTTAKAYVQLAEASTDSKKQETILYTRKASQAISRLQNLITELLDVSKIQNGKLGYNISVFNFNEIIDESIEEMGHQFPENKIIKKGSVKRKVTGDKDRLQQVLINLLTNAAKYSQPEKKVLLTITTTKDKITVAVKDFGIGISKANLEKIFDRYYRVRKNIGNQQGLGIGLYIAKEIITRHKGKIWVESETGKGSTFYFTLPFKSMPND